MIRVVLPNKFNLASLPPCQQHKPRAGKPRSHGPQAAIPLVYWTSEHTVSDRAACLPGYHGFCLRVDLTQGTAQRLPLETDLLRGYLGGSGLGVALLLREGTAPIDPLAPEARLAFVFSPLVGSPLTTSAKFAVVCKSPLTERINDALSSSSFALAGKRTGHDALLLTGCAPEWSVLVIDEERVWLEPAGHLLGLSSRATEEWVRQQLGSEFQCVSIGPAGERIVRFATLSHEGRHAGRGGSGAVLGAKKIKALAVRGNRYVTWADPVGLVELARQLSEKSFGPATAKYRELGTASNLLVFNRLNVLPTRNFQAGSFPGAAQIAPETLHLVRERTRTSCAACTIGCEHLYGRQNGSGRVRLEYENLFAFGPLCGIDDPEVILAACQRCDELGIDTISTGGTIAFAMECAERGMLNAPWLRFGEGPALLQAIELLARREGLGDLLAEGSRRMALTLGGDALRFAPQVKGLELPGYDPRGLQTLALGFAVGTRGADHNRSSAYEVDFSPAVDRRHVGPEAARLAVETEDRAALMDSLILCKFLRGVFVDLYAEAADMLRRITGWEVTPEELRQTAANIVTAKKRFNIRAGWTPAEDTLPERLLEEAPADDPQARLSAGQLRALITAYNHARGWTPEGWLPDEPRPSE